MRKTLYFLLAFCLIVSTAKGVNASTDCQRWLADYKKTLAEKTTAQHLLAARNRARAAARRKLAHLTEVPARPVPTRISSVRPHMSPAQMLKRFDLLCGDLPVENQVLDSRMAPDEFISEVSMGGPVDLLASPVDGLLVADNVPPTAPVTGIVPDSPSGGMPLVPVFGPIGGPVAGPITGGIVVPTAPGSPSTPFHPGVPVVPVAPISPVPEPSSIVLMFSGALGAAALVGRRSVS